MSSWAHSQPLSTVSQKKRGARYTDRGRASERASERSKKKQKRCCNRTQSSHLGNVGRGEKKGEWVIKNTSLSLVFSNITVWLLLRSYRKKYSRMWSLAHMRGIIQSVMNANNVGSDVNTCGPTCSEFTHRFTRCFVNPEPHSCPTSTIVFLWRCVQPPKRY